MNKTTLLLRFGYIIIIASLSYWIITGMGSRTKDYSTIESSITKILAGQSVDSEKRLEVVDFLNHRLNDEKLGADRADKEKILEKIRNGSELNFNERRQLFELVGRYTSLTVKMSVKGSEHQTDSTNIFKYLSNSLAASTNTS